MCLSVMCCCLCIMFVYSANVCMYVCVCAHTYVLMCVHVCIVGVVGRYCRCA